MIEPFEKFFRFANFFYLTIGLQPYQDMRDKNKRTINWLRTVMFYITTVNINLHLFGEIVFSVLAFYSETQFLEATITASYVGFVSAADCKMLSIWFKKKTLAKLIDELRQMYPKTVEQQEAYKLKEYLGHATKVMFLFASLYMLLIWTFNLFAGLQLAVFRYMGWEIVPELPYHIYVPFEWRYNAWYYIIYVSQDIGAYAASAGIIAADLLLCAIVTQVCMHYDYISRRVEEYVPTGRPEDNRFLNEMLDYHHKVLELTDVINSVFGIALLFNFATSSFIICFVGFQMTTTVTNEDLFRFILFLLSSLTQVFLICYYGQRITTASLNIASALFNQVWYGASNAYKKSLIIMMHRAQKPAQLKATIFLVISMQTFTDIGQLSYKFFALLRTIYGKKEGV